MSKQQVTMLMVALVIGFFFGFKGFAIAALSLLVADLVMKS